MQALSPDVESSLQAYYSILRQAYAFYIEMELTLLRTAHFGMQVWAHEAAHGERKAATMIAYYLDKRRSKAKVGAVAEVPDLDESPAKCFEAAQKVEESTSAALDELVETAVADGDDTTAEYLDYFLQMQLDEEAELDNILAWFERAGSDESALRQIDKAIKKLAKD